MVKLQQKRFCRGLYIKLSKSSQGFMGKEGDKQKMKKTIITIMTMMVAAASIAVTPLLPPAWTHTLPPAWSPATRRVYRTTSATQATTSTPISSSSSSAASTSSSANYKWILHISYITGDSVVTEADGDVTYASRTAAYTRLNSQKDLLQKDGWRLQWQTEFVEKSNPTSDSANYTAQYERNGVICVMSLNKFVLK